ncbi:MAG: hypothetical protein V1773_03620 [bacterium]
MITKVVFSTPVPISKIETFINNVFYDIREETKDIILDYFETPIDIRTNSNDQINELSLFDKWSTGETNLLGLAYALLADTDNTIVAYDTIGTKYPFTKESLAEFLEEF